MQMEAIARRRQPGGLNGSQGSGWPEARRGKDYFG